MRSPFPAGIAAALFLALAFGFGPARAEPMEDVDYVLIDPPIPPRGDRVEVIEFFHYGCGACYRFEPLLVQWLGRLPADVSFRRMPALRRMDWIPLTRLYFALEQTGELPRLHGQVYRDIHEKDLNLGNSTDAIAWAAEHGLNRAAFAAILESEQLSAEVQRARDATVAYGVRATPSMVIDGRYLTGTGMVGSVEALLPVVDSLIAKARGERRKP
ncbi:MAG TPA: thiol:disulfide interchange protein DsbA/DsbL [Burkholderiales bacterium]